MLRRLAIFVACLSVSVATFAQAPGADAAKAQRKAESGQDVVDGPDSSQTVGFLPDAIHASDIRVIDLDGLKKLLQRDPKDTRPLLINFWATWCDPCREEFPDLVKLDADYPANRLNFVAVSLDDLTDLKTAVPQFLTQMKATMPVVLLNVNDPEPAIHAVDDKWDGQLPATFLYDKTGKVVFKHFGRIKPDELRAAIDQAIANNQK